MYLKKIYEKNVPTIDICKEGDDIYLDVCFETEHLDGNIYTVKLRMSKQSAEKFSENISKKIHMINSKEQS